MNASELRYGTKSQAVLLMNGFYDMHWQVWKRNESDKNREGDNKRQKYLSHGSRSQVCGTDPRVPGLTEGHGDTMRVLPCPRSICLAFARRR